MADSKKFQVGSFYRYEEVMPACCDLMADIVEAKTGSREETLVIEGPVIYNDGTTAIIRIMSMNAELECFTLPYDDVCVRFKDLATIEKKPQPLQYYFCVDINNEVSRYYYDDDTKWFHEAVFDEDGNFEGYDYEGFECDDDDLL